MTNVSASEFDAMSKDYALHHIDEARYKWMKTKQPESDFDLYVQVTYKIIENESYMTLTNIHPDFMMTHFLMTIHGGSTYYYRNNDTIPPKSHTLKMEKSNVTSIWVSISAKDQDTGLLDMFLEKRN
jgi:hypothetical protein